MPATTAAGRKAKGKALEDHVADRIRGLGLDLRAKRDGASGAGNREKSDVDTNMQILGRGAGIECKHVDVLRLEESWDQTKKLEVLDKEPLLIFKLTKDDYGDTKVVMYLETFLEVLKKANGIGEVRTIERSNPRLKYKTEALIRAAKDFLKEHDNNTA